MIVGTSETHTCMLTVEYAQKRRIMAELSVALKNIGEAAGILFDANPAVRSVGLGRASGGFGYIAVRNKNVPVLFATNARAFPHEIAGVPVQFIDSSRDPQSLVRVHHSGVGSPAMVSLMPEQQRHRPLVCGLEIQNYDQDVRSGDLANRLMIVGTLGCFVRLSNGNIGMLSNNHVVAGENQGQRGKDAILQQGGGARTSTFDAAELTDFVDLTNSPVGATPALSNVIWNEVDAGVAELRSTVGHQQAYLPVRIVIDPTGGSIAQLGEKVHKVGRTTGLTYGEVAQIAVQVSVNYAPGLCWLRDCMLIEGLNGTTFADHGDSGSAIVRDDDGAVLGLLFAGTDSQTYACGIDNILSKLNCTMA
jgi:hypothetical protein